MKPLYLKAALLIALNAFALQGSAQIWTVSEPENLPEKRHENAMATANGKLYLL